MRGLARPAAGTRTVSSVLAVAGPCSGGHLQPSTPHRTSQEHAKAHVLPASMTQKGCLGWGAVGVRLVGRTFAACCPPRSCPGTPHFVAAEWSPTLVRSGGTASCRHSALHLQSGDNRFSVQHWSVFKASRAVLEDVSRGDPSTSKGKPVPSLRAWGPPRASTQLRPWEPTQQRQQKQWQ